MIAACLEVHNGFVRLDALVLRQPKLDALNTQQMRSVGRDGRFMSVTMMFCEMVCSSSQMDSMKNT